MNNGDKKKPRGPITFDIVEVMIVIAMLGLIVAVILGKR